MDAYISLLVGLQQLKKLYKNKICIIFFNIHLRVPKL